MSRPRCVSDREMVAALGAVDATADRCAVTSNNILGSSHQDAHAHARMMAYVAVRAACPRWSVVKIAFFFDRHPTTVLHGLRRASDEPGRRKPLGPHQQAIASIVGADPVSADDLAVSCGIGAKTAKDTLERLERRGIVARRACGYWVAA